MENLEKTDLPDGWVNATLGEVAGKITKGATPTTYGYSFQKSGINFVKVQNVTNGQINLESISDFISQDAHNNQKKSALKTDDVLFSIAGTIGETAIVKEMHLPANTNQAFAIISGFSPLLTPKFLEYQLRSFVSQKTKEKARGGAMNNVSLEDLKALGIPLPPIAEQKRIVAKIEELFSELDKGIENLKTAQAQLTVYRQALLKHAFEGKLTAAWREENKDKLESADELLRWIQAERAERYRQQVKEWESAVKELEKGGKKDSKPSKPKELPPLTTEELAELPQLPDGWGWVRVQDLAEKVTDGEHITPKRTSTGYYLLSARNIQNGHIDLSDVDYVPEEEYKRIRKRCNPEDGDILISCSGSVGRVCRVPKDLCFVMVRSVAVIKLQFLKTTTKFYEYLFQSPELQKQIEHGKKATAQANLFLDPINNLKVLVCSREEQIIIIDELETRLSEVDQLDQTITTALRQSETLRQSILKKAFSGQLVPQDPNDEPASVLLERIKAEKKAQNLAGSGKKRANTRKKKLATV